MQYRKFVIYPSDKEYQPMPPAGEMRPNYKLHLILFALTVLTTTTVGAMMVGGNPFANIGDIAMGIPFSFTLLLFLGVHEFSHYFTARRWKVQVTPPYFIPAPIFPVGTFGAVIKMRSAIPSRKALVDIGAAGPIAGFVIAVAASYIGLMLSHVVVTSPAPGPETMLLGESLLFKGLSFLVFGNLPDGMDIQLHPVAFAGWLGLFVTALNLIPFGQLDGGHVLFAISPRLHDLLRRIRIPVLLLMGLTFWYGWFVWTVILLIIGAPHPYPRHMDPQLGKLRTVISLLALIIFVLTFMPTPVTVPTGGLP